MSSRLVFALAACCAAASCFAPVSPGEPGLRVGFLDDQAFRWDASRHTNLELAHREGASVVRAIVDWARIAPRRPRHPTDPFAPAYRLDDVDELVRNAHAYGLDVLLTIWGTPGWANGDAPENVAPHDARDLRDFASALAARYSGRYPGLPFVRFYSAWNEPNSAVFLSPQFDATGRPVAPRVYAALAAAVYAGVKRASPAALVAAGETAARDTTAMSRPCTTVSRRRGSRSSSPPPRRGFASTRGRTTHIPRRTSSSPRQPSPGPTSA